MSDRNKRYAALLLLLAGMPHGCTYVSAATNLPPITPPKPQVQSNIEQTVGDFSFTLEGGKMVTSNYQGSQLNKAILGAWKERGYIRDQSYVENGAFSGAADYDLTLSGSQYGESSIGLQILSGLTLFLLPYYVTQNYDLHYALKDTKSGQLYNASVQDSETIYIELFLLFALPWAVHNHNANMARLGDHLYEQLRAQGAFQQAQPAGEGVIPGPEATPVADPAGSAAP